MRMQNNIIDHSDPGIVLKETMVQLSDEKLRAVLLRTYERAQRDMSVPKFQNHYPTFLSIAGTLFLTLLTSDFNAIGGIASGTITGLICVVCIFCACLGFYLLYKKVSEKTKNDTTDRDTAINEMFDQYCSNTPSCNNTDFGQYSLE